MAAMRRWLCKPRLAGFSGFSSALHQVNVARARAMEKDLHALESELSSSVKKQELNRIKKKWDLKSETFGSLITPTEARQALAAELREEIQQLGLSEAHGSVLQAVAQAQASPQVAAPASPQRDQRGPLALAAGAAMLGLGYWIAQPEPAAPAAPAAPAVPAAAAALPADQGSERPGPEAKAEIPAEKPAAAASKPVTEQKPPVTDGALPGVLEAKAVEPMALLAAASLVVLGLALWIWWPRGGPPGETPPAQDLPSVPPPSEASGLTTRGSEVIFENAPKEGQVWDMSASVRGIKGGVQEKINRFQG